MTFGIIKAADYVEIRMADTARAGEVSTFDVYIENDEVWTGFSVGWIFTSPDGATWTWNNVEGWGPRGEGTGSACVTEIEKSRLYPIEKVFDMTKLMVKENNTDGKTPDSILIGATRLMGTGLAIGKLQHMISFSFIPEIPDDGKAHQICVRGDTFPTGGDFVFVSLKGLSVAVEGIDVKTCFPILPAKTEKEEKKK